MLRYGASHFIDQAAAVLEHAISANVADFVSACEAAACGADAAGDADTARALRDAIDVALECYQPDTAARMIIAAGPQSWKPVFEAST